MAEKSKIVSASTAEYFSKNLQQVGFSSPVKAVLTTVKEAVDNSLDACDDHGILPEINVLIEKIGPGIHGNNIDLLRIKVEDNGPGIDLDDIASVFGEYLASSKFGKGRCSRGQQGIGISAATTWAQLTSAKGAHVITKTKSMRSALDCMIEVDIKKNKGNIKSKSSIEWDRPHGLSVEFIIEGRVQLNGEGGLLTYLNGIAIVNPHMTLTYKALENEAITLTRVTENIPPIPEAVFPHPHTMKLGEFIAYSHNAPKTKTGQWLRRDFSRISDTNLKELIDGGLHKSVLEKTTGSLKEDEFKDLFQGIQKLKLMPPSTKSVLAVGEEAFAKSIERLGRVDFFEVLTRKPNICDFKPVQVEVAIARLLDADSDTPAQLLRFANRVPLQFDKSGCAITKAIESVNWKAYNINQPKGSLPLGPYVIAVSVVSPFIKFKNASKETIDASDELVNEIRLALIQAGQKLSRHLKHESKLAQLEEKKKHIEQFAPIIVSGICRIIEASEKRKLLAEQGLRKILGRDEELATKELEDAAKKVPIKKADEDVKDLHDPDSDVISAHSISDDGEE